MRFLIVAIVASFLCGCERTMTNDQIIAETKKCEAAGLKADPMVNGWTGAVRNIQCIPKDGK